MIPTPEELAMGLIFGVAIAEEKKQEIIEEPPEEEEDNVLLSINLDEVDNLSIEIKITIKED